MATRRKYANAEEAEAAAKERATEWYHQHKVKNIK
jgi:hypothetical protein